MTRPRMVSTPWVEMEDEPKKGKRPQLRAMPNSDPEVPERAQRRRFTAEYKLRILREIEACTEPGDIGAILRREGLYSSHIANWRKLQREGAMEALELQRRGRKPDPHAAELARLKKENQRLERKLRQAEHIIDIQKSLGVAGDPPEQPRQRRERLMAAAQQLAPVTGIKSACVALGISRASLHRFQNPKPPKEPRPRPTPARALSKEERNAVLDVLHAPRFVDQAPAQVYATLLDEGKYLCSERTMYRILEANQEVRERRNQLRHPDYAKPELLAPVPIRSGAGTSPS